jgi:hypothetical protein
MIDFDHEHREGFAFADGVGQIAAIGRKRCHLGAEGREHGDEPLAGRRAISRIDRLHAGRLRWRQHRQRR